MTTGTTIVSKILEFEKCEIYVKTQQNSQEYKLADCRAKIEEKQKREYLTTLHGDEYSVLHRRYSLIVCGEIATTKQVNIDLLKTVQSYGIGLYLIHQNGTVGWLRLDDVAPDCIDLDGEWLFNLSRQQAEDIEEALHHERIQDHRSHR